MSDLPLFLGRFHPLLVHLPIGLLVAAGALQAWVWGWRRDGDTRELDFTIGTLLGIGAAGAVVAAAAGVLLGRGGGYSGDLLERHRFLGLGLAACTVATAVAWQVAWRRPRRGRRVAYGSLLVVTLALLAGTGHAGGSLTHGEGYLVELAPEWLSGGARVAPVPDEEPVGQHVVFDTLVAPLLESRCVSCHGASQPRGGLRLDGAEGIQAGGAGGTVVVPGRPGASELWRRVSLPSSHPRAMPPGGRRPASAAEGELLRWWIGEGASFEATVDEVEVNGAVRPIVEAILGPLPPPGPALPPVTPAPAAPRAIAEAEAVGFSIAPLADGIPFLRVKGTRAELDDEGLEALAPLADQIVWLDLAGTGVGDAGMETIAGLHHLTRLSLSRTGLTDAGIGPLGGLSHLESLNLYGTRVTDEGLERLASLESLRRLFLWGTATTPAGIDRLRSAVPALEVDAGSVPGSR